MNIPDIEVERILFGHSINIKYLSELDIPPYANDFGKFKEIHWLNTPGPIYTTFTDNCRTGQVEAKNNVREDDNGHEVIFKQPYTLQELKETLIAAAVDPFEEYYFDGNRFWNKANIIDWWQDSEQRINYITDIYNSEINKISHPDTKAALTDTEINWYHLEGKLSAVPEYYKYWLDFYQYGMKGYLEWYILRITGEICKLSDLDFDWTKKLELDQIFNSKVRASVAGI